MHFANYAAKVTMLIHSDGLKQTLSQYLVDRILASQQRELRAHTEVVALHGDQLLRVITLRNNETGAEEIVPTSWLFLRLGGAPHTKCWGGARRCEFHRHRTRSVAARGVPEEMAAGA
jgi:thioredoxin reductase (NADPH)